eukprot:scpid84398/ scgid34225/ 
MHALLVGCVLPAGLGSLVQAGIEPKTAITCSQDISESFVNGRTLMAPAPSPTPVCVSALPSSTGCGLSLPTTCVSDALLRGNDYAEQAPIIRHYAPTLASLQHYDAFRIFPDFPPSPSRPARDQAQLGTLLMQRSLHASLATSLHCEHTAQPMALASDMLVNDPSSPNLTDFPADLWMSALNDNLAGYSSEYGQLAACSASMNLLQEQDAHSIRPRFTWSSMPDAEEASAGATAPGLALGQSVNNLWASSHNTTHAEWPGIVANNTSNCANSTTTNQGRQCTPASECLSGPAEPTATPPVARHASCSSCSTLQSESLSSAPSHSELSLAARSPHDQCPEPQDTDSDNSIREHSTIGATARGRKRCRPPVKKPPRRRRRSTYRTERLQREAVRRNEKISAELRRENAELRREEKALREKVERAREKIILHIAKERGIPCDVAEVLCPATDTCVSPGNQFASLK